jgi:hypothetical protein
MRSPADFAGAFGVYASRFANVGWVRSANLNQPVYKRILLGFLVSNFGRECQRMAAYRYYWRPAQDYIDTNRVEGVSDLYRVLVGSCAVQFAPAVWQGWIALHGTAQKLNDAAGAYLRAKGHHTIAQHRMPRQMSNAKKALLGQFSCHP